MVQAAVSEWLLDDHKLLRKIMVNVLEKLPTNFISESSPAKKVAGSDLAKRSRLIEKKNVSPHPGAMARSRGEPGDVC